MKKMVNKQGVGQAQVEPEEIVEVDVGVKIVVEFTLELGHSTTSKGGWWMVG